MATIASLKRRIKRLEKATRHREKVMSRFDEECICFPEGHPPHVRDLIKRNIAFSVKCPLHGDRFPWEQDFLFGIYEAKWVEESNWNRVLTRNWLNGWAGPPQVPEQYCKAFLASFPADLWSVEEEEQWEEDVRKRYVRLQDGTRIQVEQYRPVGKVAPRSGFESDVKSPREATTVLKNDPKNWQTETLLTMARLLSARGRIVVPRLIKEEESEDTKQ